jgi:hypothetical protein
MTRQEKAREQAGQKSDCERDSTPSVLRHRVQLSAQIGCTFVGALNPLRVDVHWHGKVDPSRMGGLAFKRYRHARDSFMERLALAQGTNWIVIEPGEGYTYLRAVGLVSAQPRGRA